jgi:hypothetical protein
VTLTEDAYRAQCDAYNTARAEYQLRLEHFCQVCCNAMGSRVSGVYKTERAGVLSFAFRSVVILKTHILAFILFKHSRSKAASHPAQEVDRHTHRFAHETFDMMHQYLSAMARNRRDIIAVWAVLPASLTR